MNRPPIEIAPIALLKKRWLTHVVFWSVVLTVILIGTVNEKWDKKLIIVTTSEILSYVFFSYVLLFFGINRLLYRSKILLFLIFIIVLSLFFSFYTFQILLYQYKEEIGDLVTNFLVNVPIYTLFSFMITSIKIGKDYLLMNHEYEENLKNQLRQELVFLKEQLSPHFLLNTMNNLYGLAVAKSDQLPGLMLRLSDLLRYSLYDTKTDRVALKDEINYLKDYIELQKIRLNANTQLEVQFPQTVEVNYSIAPLILVVFVENTFKHLNQGKKSSQKYIKIRLDIEDHCMVFSTENTYNESFLPISNDMKTNDGIGLKNTLRRIELLYGKDSLPIIDADGDVYRVKFKILLHDGNY
jgi:two-component system, LytTR family, sensor histidine kinase LytS